MKNIDLFLYWVREREAVRKKKEGGESPPWTDDPILQKYKFTNIRREDDRTSRWVAKNWRTPASDHPDLFFLMAIAVLVNNPDTMQQLWSKEEVSSFAWDANAFIQVLNNIKFRGHKVFSGAYIVSTNGHKMAKPEYIAKEVLDPIWRNRTDIRPVKGSTCQYLYNMLMQFDGMGSFIAAQVVAATKYEFPLFNAIDWYYFVASGPGSRRGMNRLLGFPIDSKRQDWHYQLGELRKRTNQKLNLNLSAQDIQNCLCEFDKYCRVLHGEGRPRSKYPGEGK